MLDNNRKTPIALCVIGALATPPALADEAVHESGHQEQIGLGAGALLGAIVGGPPGLILGAFGGALIGRTQDADEQLADQQHELLDNQQRIAQLRRGQQQHDRRIAANLQLARQHQATLATIIAKGMSYTVQFRSDSAHLEPHYQRDLQQLAQAVAMFRDLPYRPTVHLTGHADPRGSDRHNLELSQRRVEVVRAYLLHTGLSDACIDRKAVGEQQATARQGNAEDLFFDRRVRISVSLTGEST